jgi:Lrp/AsnC family leucine-responsive transcriptional regulator
VIDAIDRDILAELQRDARISYKDLASRVQLSPNAVAERVRQLMKSGVIEGFRAEISLAATGLGLQSFIDVKLRTSVPADEFEKAVGKIPGILQLMLTTGSFDYSLRVACKDQKDLVRLVEELRAVVPVAETYSRVILREHTIAKR